MLDFLRSCPQYIANGLANGCIYILVAMGLNIIYNPTGIINFAQGQFCMFGALFVYTFSVSLGLPVTLAIFLAVLVTAAIGGPWSARLSILCATPECSPPLSPHILHLHRTHILA